MSAPSLGRALEMQLKDRVAQMTFPGFSELDFTNNGQIKLWKLSRLFEAGRTIAIRILNLANMRTHLGEGMSLFVRYIQYSFSTKMDSLEEAPLKLLVSLLSCGNTSLVLKETIHRADNMLELASATLRYVYVDMKTRKSAPLPPDVRDYCLIDQGNRPGTLELKYNLPTRPDQCYWCDFEVEPNHIDHNRHTNQSMYVQFCWDTAAQAVLKGCFKGQNLSTWAPCVTNMLTVYESESREGDHLVVYLWQQNLPRNIIYFSITMQDKVIFKCCWTLSEDVCLSIKSTRL